MKNQRIESLGSKSFEILVAANGGVHAPSMLTKHARRRVANAAGAARDEHISNFRTRETHGLEARASAPSSHMTIRVLSAMGKI